MYETGHLGAIKALVAAIMVLGTVIGPGVTGILIDLGFGLERQFIAIAGYFVIITVFTTIVYDHRHQRFSESLSWKASVEARSVVRLEYEDRVMPAPLPKEVRDRFARPIVEGVTGRDAARRLQVSAATGGRWGRQIRRNGAATVAPMGRPSGSGKRAPHGGIFRASAMQDPDITLFELRDALAAAEGVTVRHSAIAGLLKRLGLAPRHYPQPIATRRVRRLFAIVVTGSSICRPIHRTSIQSSRPSQSRKPTSDKLARVHSRPSSRQLEKSANSTTSR